MISEPCQNDRAFVVKRRFSFCLAQMHICWYGRFASSLSSGYSVLRHPFLALLLLATENQQKERIGFLAPSQCQFAISRISFASLPCPASSILGSEVPSSLVPQFSALPIKKCNVALLLARQKSSLVSAAHGFCSFCQEPSSSSLPLIFSSTILSGCLETSLRYNSQRRR